MAKSHFSKKGIIFLSVIVVVMVILVIPPQPNKLDFKSDDFNLDIENEKNIIDNAVNSLSVVDSETFTESDSSIITNFFDSQNIDLPLSTEKFAIETQIALFDSDQKLFPSSSIFGVPELSVIDEQGRLLDLGKIQVSFLGVTQHTEKSVNVWGRVNFYLDDELIDNKSKYLWVSSSNTDKSQLFIVNNLMFDENNNPINPSFSDRKTNFTFTLSDEGRDWQDGSEHYYRVVVTDIHAVAQSDNKIKTFSKSGENIVYELKVKVDGAKKVILTSDNIVTQVFKSDGTLRLCGSITKSPSFYVKYPSPVVSLLINDVPVVSNVQANLDVTYGYYQGLKCDTVYDKIPRNSNVSFILDGERWDVVTPMTQKNYDISTKWLQDGWGGNILHGHVYSNIDNFAKPTWDTLYHPTHRPAIGLPT